jgi:DNA-3-methyladenine glycosylase I
MQQYHDTEWGVAVHDDRLLFEHIVLDGFQAGLSWQTILNKRENFRKAFLNFDIEKVAHFDHDKVEELMQNDGIVRNRLKITAAINNALRVLEIQKEYGSFDKYIWSFTGGTTIWHHFSQINQVPATSPESDNMCADLKKKGFKFMGSTICYAFMQASGMVNDHLTYCERYRELS